MNRLRSYATRSLLSAAPRGVGALQSFVPSSFALSFATDASGGDRPPANDAKGAKPPHTPSSAMGRGRGRGPPGGQQSSAAPGSRPVRIINRSDGTTGGPQGDSTIADRMLQRGRNNQRGGGGEGAPWRGGSPQRGSPVGAPPQQPSMQPVQQPVGYGGAKEEHGRRRKQFMQPGGSGAQGDRAPSFQGQNQWSQQQQAEGLAQRRRVRVSPLVP
eukprot:1187278-Prorocentrum_minimum.AAC.3